MSTTIYLLEPGATAPPPRIVRTSFRAKLLLTSGFILFAAILLGGIVAVGEAGQIVWLSAAGKPITAHVVGVSELPQPRTQGAPPVRYAVDYRFDAPFEGRRTPETRRAWIENPSSSTTSSQFPMSMSQPASKPSTKTFHVGDVIAFRYACIGSRIVLHPWSPPPYGHMALLGGIGVALMAVGVTFLLRLVHWHRRRMRLLRHGIGVTGSIVSKRVDGVEGKYFLTYSYPVRGEATVREREEQCTSAQWKIFDEKDVVTLLYDPDKVERVGLYRLLSDV